GAQAPALEDRQGQRRSHPADLRAAAPDEVGEQRLLADIGSQIDVGIELRPRNADAPGGGLGPPARRRELRPPSEELGGKLGGKTERPELRAARPLDGGSAVGTRAEEGGDAVSRLGNLLLERRHLRACRGCAGLGLLELRTGIEAVVDAPGYEA